MSLTEVVVQGTLNPDGTLNLDEKPSLSPGRVTVVLRQESKPTPTADWWEFMQSARKKMVEAGCHFMDEKEIQAHIEWLREGDRIDDMLSEGKEQQLKSEQP
jgi:predicted amidohydrolase